MGQRLWFRLAALALRFRLRLAQWLVFGAAVGVALAAGEHLLELVAVIP
jgi:hypothetical protein